MNLILHKTLHHYFPKLNRWFSNIKDPRQENSKVYKIEALIWVGIYMFLLKLGSRRSINFKFKTKAFRDNLSKVSKTSLDSVPNDVTLSNLFERLPALPFQGVIVRMVRTLIRNKVLEKHRLYGYYLIAVDGTGYLKFKERHCEHCIEMGGDQPYYTHPVLEAKLITPCGLAISIGTEFIENPDKKYIKQDCELKAFYRYVKRLKSEFPQLRICLLLDGLYANQNVVDICEKNKWKYIITLKEGSLLNVYKEFETLKRISPDNRKECEDEKIRQLFSWVNGIDYEGHFLNILECEEIKNQNAKGKNFVWMTNFNINRSNCHMIANRGGRLRWKIENEGFNTQKRGGYDMEHVYSRNNVALKNFYLILQIAHTINQLIEKGSLISEAARKKIGSVRNIAFLLLESLRNTVLDFKEIEQMKLMKFQIRLDSS